LRNTAAAAATAGEERVGHRRSVRSHAAGNVGHGSYVGPSSEK
jgi:hypothetical protein